MVGETDMPERWMPHESPPARGRHLVVVENIESVGLALALSLLQAGYGVLGSNVSDACRSEFEDAGGVVAATTQGEDDIDWSITCHEKQGIRPEVLSRLSSARHEYGRPRLELTGANRSVEGRSHDALASLSIGRGHDPSVVLRIALEVKPKGFQLIVRGERPLFEAALPVLTVLADRVLYAGPGQESDERMSRETGSRNQYD